ncbi:MAG: hypothetical protein F6K22_18395 [Okeania sp. SIO2F4]|uniref:hypothetical protein n=1 Tax=Okeania sp. SIO2F4 TaxID=2607790 RepID=UPI0014290E1B|nr:hypothetical protein [Okeania sp. SIO2F4]NES04626.1 hypothetical protein [Okeania sp. SIO2F4]
MIAPLRTMILAIIILKSKISFHGYFVWAVLISALFYSNLQSDNFLFSFLGHPTIGGGLIDFILISLLPLSLPAVGFRFGVLSLAIILLFGYGGEHRQELANAFLAPSAFIFSPLQSLLLLFSAITCHSRSAVAVIAFAIISSLRSPFLRTLIFFLVISVISVESYHRYHYIIDFGNHGFWNAITTDRLVQWKNLPSQAVGIDGAISHINTVKFHNAFVDFRVISGSWALPLWWSFLIFSYYEIVPTKILLSFVFVQLFWYNSVVILFGWFFVINQFKQQKNFEFDVDF